MIEHIVLFKVRDTSNSSQKDQMMRRLLDLKTKIPGILQATAGVNFSQRARGYTHGFVVRFVDRTALDSYMAHPEHQAVVEQFVRPIAEEVLALDYEIL